MTNRFYPRPKPTAAVPWLGGLSPNQFMARYWQKKPLLVRNAFPDFEPAVSIDEVLALCTQDTLQTRLIQSAPKGRSRHSGNWSLAHGPFRKRDLPKISDPNWTVLVQQVNTLLPAADRFLDAFRFIPEARLDDLMISVAGPGGGIGAHTDSYDVFLVQAQGQRRWEIAQHFAPAFIEDLPLKILRSFQAEHEWLLHPGDLLYLPPQVAHRGTAVGTGCMTWSIGFRAPGRLALADQAFSQHLDQLEESDWRDPWLKASAQPGEIPERLLAALTRQVLQTFPDRAALRSAIARALSEPAPSAVFAAPQPAPTLRGFLSAAKRHGIALSPASRLLYVDQDFYINGEAVSTPLTLSASAALRDLADHRRLSAPQVKRAIQNPSLADCLLQMARAGWIVYH